MIYPEEIVQAIKNGGVGVMPTDTVFGIVAKALDQRAVERIYDVKGRTLDKPFIVLISNIAQLEELSIITNVDTSLLVSMWQKPVSLIMTCESEELSYLHRGTYSLAVRLPNNSELIELISKVGPIVATSANVSGQPTPASMQEIRSQLPGLDFYLDGSTASQPSRLARMLKDGTLEWLNRD